ncbi:MAG: energy-coupling factor transporter ATPase [Erysipelotrichaceae bacterium]|jgi:energy-coupling factor transport system ATP-binding protein|nr:energy-coupling factor transporter ATPase [Erysipelotrichaceae bacterium]
MSKLEIKNLTFSYDNKINVIDDISFKVEKGQFVSIIGHNGSGKSTLAKLIVGLLDKNNGQIFFDNEEITKKNMVRLQSKTALVFQNPDNQFIGATVEDDIAFGLENINFPHEKMQEEIERFAKEVGMFEYLNKEPSNLSGGQKQRVAIAGALILHPEILILDEATSMLDPKGKATVRRVIDRLHQEKKDLTIIAITHDIDEAMLSDEVLVLSRGKLIKKGSPKIVLRDEETLRSLRLDMPFVYRLEKGLKSLGIKAKAETVDQLVEDIWASK